MMLMLLFFLICDIGVPCQINYMRKLIIQQIFSTDLFWLLFALTSDTALITDTLITVSNFCHYDHTLF
jgi:hypothetical protein